MNPKKTAKSKNPEHTPPTNSTPINSTSEDSTPEVEGLSFSALLEAIPHLVIVTNKNGLLRYVNRRWLEYTGLNGQQTQGLGWLGAIHPYNRPQVQQSGRLNPTSQPHAYEIEYLLRRHDGVYLWFLECNEPLLETLEGVEQFTGWVCAITEIDQQKRTLDTFEYLYQTTPNGVLYQSATGEITAANPAAQQILGLSLEELQRRTSDNPNWQAVRPDGTPLPSDEHPPMLALRSKKPILGMMMGIHNPVLNQRRWILVDAVPQFQLGEDHPYQVYSHFEDITEREKVRLELEQAASKLEKIATEREKVRTELREVALELEDVALEREKVRVELKHVALELEKVALEREKVSTEQEKVRLELKKVALELENVAFERERLLEQLSLERVRLDAVLAQMPPGVVIVDADNGRVSLVNTQMERIFDIPFTPGMTLERTFLPTFHPNGERLKRAEFPLNRALEGKIVSSQELEIERPDGSRAIVLASAVPIHDRLGKIVAAVFTCEDLTERRRSEAEVKRLTRSIQSAREALTLHGGRPVTPERFVELMGELYNKLGQPQLEGGLVALLLLRAEPMSLGEAAKLLGVSKVAISKVSNTMLERGDLLISKAFSSREHLLALTNHSYIRDLSVRRVASWAISILCDAMLEANHLEPAVTEQVRTHLETHTRVAVALEQVLSQLEQGQANSLATHFLENWDAVHPKDSAKNISEKPEE